MDSFLQNQAEKHVKWYNEMCADQMLTNESKILPTSSFFLKQINQNSNCQIYLSNTMKIIILIW